MNQLRKISTLVSLGIFVTCLISCSVKEDEATQKSEQVSYLLFNKIPLTLMQDGSFEFTEGKNNVQAAIKELLITKNQALSQIDDFGFGKDDFGNRYFYARETSETGSRSLFAPFSIKGVIVSSEEVTQRGVIQVPVTLCLNQHCCDVCGWQNYDCICHDQNFDCQRRGELMFICSPEEVIIGVPY